MIEDRRTLTINEWRNIIREEVDLLYKRYKSNCVNCLHFESDTQQCRLVGRMPPPKVVIVGCEYWDEEIPF